RRVLLILDNCEPVLRACGEMASTLLKACSDLHLLLTSREPVRIASEYVWREPPLSLPDDGDESRPPLQASDAVRLFLARAPRRVPRFLVTERNLRLAAHICRRLDGLPLAVELAAARVESFDLADIASRLDAGLVLRIRGPRSAHARHQTLRSTLT